MSRSGVVTVTAVDRGGMSPGSGLFHAIHKEMYAELAREDRRMAMLAREKLPAGTLTAPALVALTTFCALEWLRHRKHEVAAAEASGDYSSLMAEFVTWLRALFAAWRGKLAEP